tara:strand:+ start:574 stop:1176 length:603 start_codon:yes stop_codon:yes gene_type:complete
MNVQFHFDFGSPNAYLSHLIIPGIEQRTGVTFDYIPALIGGVFKATNNASPMVTMAGVLNKPEYQALETERFLEKHKITNYQSNPFFPVNTLQIMRGAVFAQQQPYFKQYVDEVYRHMWAEPKKMDEPDVIRQALESAALPVDEIFAGMVLPETKQALIANTNRSVEMGAFGSPTFFVDGEIFFGKDKLWEVEEMLSSQD